MSGEGGDGGVLENPTTEAVANHEAIEVENEKLNLDAEVDSSLVKRNGLHGRSMHCNYSDNDNELLQSLLELDFKNEYMKSQFQGFNIVLVNSAKHGSQNETMKDNHLECHDVVKELTGKLESLKIELQEERLTRVSAEEALKHLRAGHSEADMKAQELSVKLDEAQQKMDQEIKERDEKYSELDSKFNRLHKRAKQRIQDVQKEKDDLEAKFSEVAEKAEKSSSQLSALQQELERTRQNANEALKAMDVERQQLRSVNNKLRDNIEELRHSLVPKESALETLQHSLLEKEKMLEDMRGLLQIADEKRQASITEISLKHQKQVENMEAQIADVLADRSRASETISSLRALIVEKDAKIAEMEAASSGEVARLRAAMEALKGEFSHRKNEHEKEKEIFEAAFQSMRTKLEISESNRIHVEVEAAKLRSQLESELSVQIQLLNSKDTELEALRGKIDQIESEFASYKVRAHSLLQKKEAELVAVRDSDQLKAHEEALKEAEREILSISAEKDKALQDLKDALTNCQTEIATRDAALVTAEQHIKSIQMNLDSAFSLHQSEKETLERDFQNMEETWRLRYEALSKQNELPSCENFQKEVEELRLHCKNLKEEQISFHDLADKMMEEKDKEISRLLDDNKNLRQSLDLRPHAMYQDDLTISAYQKQESSNSSVSAAEQQILILARQQAQREEELAQTQRHILVLQEEIEELEHENRLHRQQESMLKEELRNTERMQKREGVDMTYVKNVILKLLETGEVERLLPVIAILLQFSPDEVQKCQQAYRASGDVPPSPASDSSGSALSLFSRFSFS
ncbi:protein GRIP isoform X1 [Primulina tabacum]|uniref:protein GRIP isoform X1 n=2 Tax=Primulina tabacum TaxID=48773 RepID=UPI003F5A2673